MEYSYLNSLSKRMNIPLPELESKWMEAKSQVHIPTTDPIYWPTVLQTFNNMVNAPVPRSQAVITEFGGTLGSLPRDVGFVKMHSPSSSNTPDRITMPKGSKVLIESIDSEDSSLILNLRTIDSKYGNYSSSVTLESDDPELESFFK